jgi:hypothetical protein
MHKGMKKHLDIPVRMKGENTILSPYKIRYQAVSYRKQIYSLAERTTFS